MTRAAQRIYELIPAIYRIRDEKRGGPLKELVGVIAEQASVMEENLEQLYDDQFIETCAQWVVPYIGDLIGTRQLHSDIPKVASSRAEVANTIAYRRRKGTACVLEQLARDVTGWNARAVEFFQILATTQYMNHTRPNNWYSPDLRQWEPLERINTAFDSISHTVDTRSPSLQAGRHNIPNIGIYLWRLSAYSLTKSPAPTLDGRRFFFSPLGHNMQLFTRPVAEKEITHLAEPINVPEPISRNVLDAYKDMYYGDKEELSLNLWIDGDPVAVERINVCNHEDYAGDWAHPNQSRISIDPLLGRIMLPPELAAVNSQQTLKISGFTGGDYKIQFNGQELKLTHSTDPASIQSNLQSLSTIGVNNIIITGNVTATEIDIMLEFIGVLSGKDVPEIAVDVSNLSGDPQATITQIQSPQPGSVVQVRYHYGFSMDMGGGEYERAAGFVSDFSPDQTVKKGDVIQPKLDAVKDGGTVQIEDSGLYRQSFKIAAAETKQIEIRSANKHRSTIISDENIEITGADQSTIVLNGLLVSGGALIVPQAENKLKHLVIRDCTFVPGRDLTVDGDPVNPRAPSLIVDAPDVKIQIDRSILGALHISDQSEVEIMNSIIDANNETHIAYSNSTVDGPGAQLKIINSTIIGKVHTQKIILASNVIFKSRLSEEEESWNAPIICEQKQSGCIRFSYVPVGSRVPRRYRCQPDLAVDKAIDEKKKRNSNLSITEKQKIAQHIQMAIKPVFTSRHYGTPGYCQLSLICPNEIRAGADDESEMGVFHDLYQPQREKNLKLRLDEYLRFGLEAGLFYAN